MAHPPRPPPPPGTALVASPPLPPSPTTASPQFLAINTNHVFSPHYDWGLAVQRAIKVFVASFPEFDNSSPQWFKDKFLQYIADVQTLYGVNINVNQAINAVYNDIIGDEFYVLVKAKRFRGRNVLTNPRLVLNYGPIIEVPLDVTVEVQPNNPMVLAQTWAQFAGWRRNVTFQISLDIQSNETIANTIQLNTLQIQPAGTLPEGYEDWFDFGSGVQLLISIDYSSVEPYRGGATPVMTSNFHLRTISAMIARRLQDYNGRTSWTNLGHREIKQKSRVTTRRPAIAPVSPDLFWKVPLPSEKLSKTVPYVDLQIPFDTNEDFDEMVCLCHEWCNWNAFFYYNPMYRFLIVRHKQLYLPRSGAHIPDMYLCCSVSTAVMGIFPKTPIISLMYWANEYRKRFFQRYFLRSQWFRDQYNNNSTPVPQIMNALTYSNLRYHLNLF